MKVDDLTGALLDYWVAKAEGMTRVVMVKGSLSHENSMGGYYRFNFRPSSNWLTGGPIIEREGICTALFMQGEPSNPEPEWRAGILDGTGYFASLDLSFSSPTLLIAAMRCYVQSKFGDQVSE